MKKELNMIHTVRNYIKNEVKIDSVVVLIGIDITMIAVSIQIRELTVKVC